MCGDVFIGMAKCACICVSIPVLCSFIKNSHNYFYPYFFLYESYLVCDQILPRRKQNLIQTPRFSTHIIENQKPINTQLFPRSIERRSIIPPSKWKVLSLYEKTWWMEFAVFISFGGLTDEMKVGWTVLFPLSAQHIVIQSTSFFLFELYINVWLW